MELLKVSDLNIQIGGQQIVEDINFSIQEGETLGIVGESGSGKTITVLSLLRLLPDNSRYKAGKVLYLKDGEWHDLIGISDEKIQKIRGAQISVIFQEPMSSLNPLMSCGKQIEEVFKTHHLQTRSEYKAATLEWLRKVGLDDAERVYSAFPHELSGGQLQRVLIAIALCAQPKLVIADEPTTALDVSIQKKILELLLQLKIELKLSLIFISHDLGVIKSICDRVLVMKNGTIIEQGSTSQIFYQPAHNYTKGLIMCRPPLDKKWRRLPTVQDFTELKRTNNFFSNDTFVIHPTEQDRHIANLDQGPTILEVKNLEVSYPLRRNWFGRVIEFKQALHPISFDLKKSEILGLVGESGSGKSSMGKAILNLIPFKADVLKFEDTDLLTLNSEDWRKMRKSMQVVFQDPFSSLNPRKSIGDAIIEPMKVHSLYNSYNSRFERAVEILEWVGLHADHMSRYPHQFSGGQRQRIGIARALSLNPSFIVCDESVSALDVSIQAQILNLLLDLKDKLKLSYLFISHDLSVVNFIADRIMVLNEGKIEEMDKSYKILNKPQSEYTKKLIDSIPK